MTPLGIASKRRYIHIVRLMLRVIDRLLRRKSSCLSLAWFSRLKTLDAGARSSYAEYYAKRSSRNLPWCESKGGNRILFMTIMPLPRASISYESCLNGYCTVSNYQVRLEDNLMSKGDGIGANKVSSILVIGHTIRSSGLRIAMITPIVVHTRLVVISSLDNTLIPCWTM